MPRPRPGCGRRSRSPRPRGRRATRPRACPPRRRRSAPVACSSSADRTSGAPTAPGAAPLAARTRARNPPPPRGTVGRKVSSGHTTVVAPDGLTATSGAPVPTVGGWIRVGHPPRQAPRRRPGALQPLRERGERVAGRQRLRPLAEAGRERAAGVGAVGHDEVPLAHLEVDPAAGAVARRHHLRRRVDVALELVVDRDRVRDRVSGAVHGLAGVRVGPRRDGAGEDDVRPVDRRRARRRRTSTPAPPGPPPRPSGPRANRPRPPP